MIRVRAGRGGSLLISVHAKPGTHVSKAGVFRSEAGSIEVRVCERAIDGKANAAVLHALADALGVPFRTIELISGDAARDKVVAITAGGTVDSNEIETRLKPCRYSCNACKNTLRYRSL
jgi:uncharacterized protein YggU (UPF0235/DUF167 family)